MASPRAPDLVEPRVGWRVWAVVERDGRHVLSSLVYGEEWPVRSELVARCRRPLAALPWGRLPLHEPPALDCVCGLHALASARAALAFLTVDTGRPARFPRVVGRVSLWGRVVEGPAGWRARCGYPERLVVPDVRPWSARLRRLPAPGLVAADLAAYGVRVDVVEAAEPALLEALAG